MPRKKKTDDPIGVGLTAKQMRRKKPINSDLLVDIDPLTTNQEKFFEEYDAGKHLFALDVPVQVKHSSHYTRHLKKFLI